MLTKGPKNTRQYHWTEHVKFKMRHYGLSPQRVLGIISKPARKEEGIVKNTIAVMKPVSVKTTAGKPIWKQEIWAMYQRNKKSRQIKIISAWRYPGVSPQKNPIPEEIINEIAGLV